jgi:hypothetical protein
VMATPKIEVGESLSEDPPDKNMRPYLWKIGLWFKWWRACLASARSWIQPTAK